MAPGTKVVQKKPAIEYREPLAKLGERYLGICENFTKKQIEAVAAEMPAYFLSIKGQQGPNGICLFSSSVFSPRTLEDMVKKLKASCAKWAGEGSEDSCKKLVANLADAKQTKEPLIKPYDPHNPKNIDPRHITFWVKLADALITGTGFVIPGIILGEIGSRIFTGKGIIKNIKEWRNRRKNGKRKDDDDLQPPRVGGGTQEQPQPRPESIAGQAGSLNHGYVAAIAPELSFELFSVRVLKALGPEAGYDFIMQHGHDFEALNLLPEDAFAQTVREYAMWDGIIDMPVSEAPATAKAPTVAANVPMNTAARDLIASGAAYLGQAHVKASIQKFRLEHVNEKFALLRGRDGKLYTLPKMQLPASARVRSIVSVNVAALRPAPVGFRVPIRVAP